MARGRDKPSRAVKLKLPVVLALCCSSLLCGLLIGQRQAISDLPSILRGAGYLKAAEPCRMDVLKGTWHTPHDVTCCTFAPHTSPEALKEHGVYMSCHLKHEAATPEVQEFSSRRKLEAVSGEHSASLVSTEPHTEILPVTDTGRQYLSRFQYQVLSFKPRAVLFRNFAPLEKCDEIVKLAEKQLAPSGLALRKGETDETTKDIRTSSGTFLAAHQDASGSLDWVERAIAEATMIPLEHGEAFNVLRYEIGQKYNSHYDYFATDEYGPQDSQRMASFLLYLSDVEEGGETMFPYENGENMDSRYDFQACIGLKVKPRKGDGLLFWSLTPNGTYDKTSLHGSCPVVKGQKWVATKWIRDKPIR